MSGSSTEPTTTTSVETGGTSTGLCGDDGLDEGPKFDLGAPEPACDLFEQDCPDGDRCVPQDFWTRLCVPVQDEPVPDGETCMPMGAHDPCDVGSWCRRFGGVGPGVCVPLCTGSYEAPECPADTICVIDDERVAASCEPPCDPFDDAPCDEGGGCKPTPFGFGCVPEGSWERGEGCVEHDSCADSLACASLDETAGCCDGTCCTALCDAAHPCDLGSCAPILPPIAGAPDVGFCV